MSFLQVHHDIVNPLGASGLEPNIDRTAFEDAELGWTEVIPSSGGGGRGVQRHGGGKKNNRRGSRKDGGRGRGNRDAEPVADIVLGMQAAARGTR